ncbi:MAG: hypothetical protein HY842_13625 [Bacteroidetes bacterium]|nr:hypothetical protein [Bacteroidota bacterium]
MLLFLALIAVGNGCETKKTGTDGQCQTLATVRDFDGLDGCGYLFELPNGDLLNPVSLPEGFQPKDKQAVRIDYKILPDMAGICMSEKAMVEITCLEDLSAKPATADCASISNPFAVPWMDKAIDRHNPVKIIKYQIGGKWAFAFQAIPTTYLYDCNGNLLCQTDGDDNDDCHRQYLNFVSKGKTIWQGEGVWD